jgi:MFS family permease
MALLSPLAGRLSDRIEPRLIASAGMALTVVGLAMLVFLSQDTGLGLILTSLVILGLGFALFSAPNTNAIMSSVERKFYGVASGVVGTMRSIGQMLSLGIVMLLFSIYAGELQITAAHSEVFLQGMRVAFIIFAVLCSGGVFASLARGKVHSAPTEDWG